MADWEMQATPQEFESGTKPGLQNRLDHASKFRYRAQLHGLDPFYADSPLYPEDVPSPETIEAVSFGQP